MNRRDLLSECARSDMPIDVLTAQWCARCGNPECSRSAVGFSKFDKRTANWEEKLFKNPPTLAPDDPRFGIIVAQKFITIDPGRTPEIRSDWKDPRDLKEPEEAPAVVIVTEPAPLIVPPAPAEARPPSPPKPLASSPSSRLALVGANTPDQSAKLLRGALSAPTTVVDPWSPPDAPDPADVLVQPGAKIKMGGGSGV